MRKSKLRKLRIEEFEKSLENRPVEVNEQLDAQIIEMFELYYKYTDYLKLEAQAEKEAKRKRRRFLPRTFSQLLRDSLRVNPYRSELSTINITEIKAKLKEYEPLLDKKYWDLSPLFFMRYYIHKGYVQTLEQAVDLYEQKLAAYE